MLTYPWLGYFFLLSQPVTLSCYAIIAGAADGAAAADGSAMLRYQQNLSVDDFRYCMGYFHSRL